MCWRGFLLTPVEEQNVATKLHLQQQLWETATSGANEVPKQQLFAQLDASHSDIPVSLLQRTPQLANLTDIPSLPASQLPKQ